MGQCLSAEGVEGLKTAGNLASRRASQMSRPGGAGTLGPSRKGPDDIENQLFHDGETGPLFPKRTPDRLLAVGRPRPGAGPQPPVPGAPGEAGAGSTQPQIQDASVSSEVGNLAPVPASQPRLGARLLLPSLQTRTLINICPACTPRAEISLASHQKSRVWSDPRA